jgi:hypothetical protein
MSCELVPLLKYTNYPHNSLEQSVLFHALFSGLPWPLFLVCFLLIQVNVVIDL